MTSRWWLILVVVVAALHGLFFIWYQQPDWNTAWSDQDGYRRLGHVLAETGKFTRFPDAPRLVPEVIRTPAYPLFVATVDKLAGAGQLPVALAQTGLFVLICLTVFAIARIVVPNASEPVAVAAAMVTAFYPPIPYFGALVMTEVWTTFLFTLALWVTLLGLREHGWKRFALVGFLLAATTLSRPVFVLFPLALALVGLVGFPLMHVKGRPTIAPWVVLLFVFAVTMVPWFTYNYVTLDRFTLSPAGGIGRGIWEGSWQAVWPGRVQNELTHLADDLDDRAALDGAVQAVATREHLPPGPMEEYIHQWADIHRIWTAPVDPTARTLARVEADRQYLRVGLENIRRDSTGHLVKRLARGLFILWAGEIPFRYSEINRLPPAVIRLCWAAQAVIFLCALVGVYAIARSGRVVDASVLALPIVYISAVHLPLFTEARQSLPAQPVLLILATIGVANLTSRSLARKPQVHEREHL